jgi:hypothetical protein
LRAEVDYLKERKPDGASVTNRTTVMAAAANGNHSDLESRLGRLEAELDKQAAAAAELRTAVIAKESECGQLRQLIVGLEARQRDHEAAVTKALSELQQPAVSTVVNKTVEEEPPAAVGAPAVDIAQKIAEIAVCRLKRERFFSFSRKAKIMRKFSFPRKFSRKFSFSQKFSRTFLRQF